MEGSTRALLQAYCEAVVPLAIREIEAAGGLTDRAIASANRDGWYLSEHGDAVLYRVKGTTNEAIAALVRGLATLALQPGGVTFLDMHFEVGPPVPQESDEAWETWRAALERAWQEEGSEQGHEPLRPVVAAQMVQTAMDFSEGGNLR